MRHHSTLCGLKWRDQPGHHVTNKYSNAATVRIRFRQQGFGFIKRTHGLKMEPDSLLWDKGDECNG